MASLTVEGVYRDGKVEFAKVPPQIEGEARVLVIFPDAPPQAGSADVTGEARREAIDRLLSRFEEGIPFGGPPYPKREDLYDRVYKFDQRDG